MIGKNRQLVALEAPTSTTMDGAGGYIETWGPLDPASWYCAFEDATAAAMEREGFGTAYAQATHILSGRFHSGLSPKARVRHDGRLYSVLSALDREQRHIQSVILCAEILP